MRIAGAVTALRTLTVLRIPGRDAEDFADALPWFPLGGLVYGLSAFGLAQCAAFLPVQVVAALILVVFAWLSGGLHLDGLADCADGLGGGRTRARALEIMKDSRVGAYGVMAIVLDQLLKWSLFTALIEADLARWFIPIGLFSRALQVELMVCLPYARKEGTAGVFVERAGLVHRILVFIPALLCAVLLGWPGMVALLVAWVIAHLWGWYVRKRVAGITGDLLGAASELVELAVALVPLIVAGVLHLR